jgi:multidrug resistance efflux pump
VDDQTDAVDTAQDDLRTAQKELAKARKELAAAPADPTKAAAVDSALEAVKTAEKDLRGANADLAFYKAELARVKGTPTVPKPAAPAVKPAPPAPPVAPAEVIDTTARKNADDQKRALQLFNAMMNGGELPDGTNNDGTPRTLKVTGAIPAIDNRVKALESNKGLTRSEVQEMISTAVNPIRQNVSTLAGYTADLAEANTTVTYTDRSGGGLFGRGKTVNREATVSNPQGADLSAKLRDLAKKAK